MEELFEAALAVAIVAISFMAKNRKKTVRKPVTIAPSVTQIPSAPAEKTPPAALDKVLHAAPAEKTEEKPAQMPDHEHEGKDPSCPKDQPLISWPDAQKQEKPAAAAIPGLNIAFDRQSVVQGVIMSEVLTRPAFKNGRRVIR